MRTTGQALDWLKQGRYLPRFLRDFHDQKDFFKTVEDRCGRGDGHWAVNWMQGQVYVIDKFLYFMAMHGYTLQRSRTQIEFEDIDATLKVSRKARMDRHFAVLNEGLARVKKEARGNR